MKMEKTLVFFHILVGHSLVSAQYASLLTGLFDTITATTNSNNCPGACYNVLLSFACDHVLDDEQYSCQDRTYRCCVDRPLVKKKDKDPSPGESPSNGPMSTGARPTVVTSRPTTTDKVPSAAPYPTHQALVAADVPTRQSTIQPVENEEAEDSDPQNFAPGTSLCPGVCVAAGIASFCDAILAVDGMCNRDLKCCVTKDLFPSDDLPEGLVLNNSSELNNSSPQTPPPSPDLPSTTTSSPRQRPSPRPQERPQERPQKIPPHRRCNGTCVTGFFSFLCDDIDRRAICPGGGTCCITRRVTTSTESGVQNIPGTTSTPSPSVPTPTTSSPTTTYPTTAPPTTPTTTSEMVTTERVRVTTHAFIEPEPQHQQEHLLAPHQSEGPVQYAVCPGVCLARNLITYCNPPHDVRPDLHCEHSYICCDTKGGPPPDIPIHQIGPYNEGPPPRQDVQYGPEPDNLGSDPEESPNLPASQPPRPRPPTRKPQNKPEQPNNGLFSDSVQSLANFFVGSAVNQLFGGSNTGGNKKKPSRRTSPRPTTTPTTTTTPAPTTTTTPKPEDVRPECPGGCISDFLSFTCFGNGEITDLFKCAKPGLRCCAHKSAILKELDRIQTPGLKRNDSYIQYGQRPGEEGLIPPPMFNQFPESQNLPFIPHSGPQQPFGQYYNQDYYGPNPIVSQPGSSLQQGISSSHQGLHHVLPHSSEAVSHTLQTGGPLQQGGSVIPVPQFPPVQQGGLPHQTLQSAPIPQLPPPVPHQGPLSLQGLGTQPLLASTSGGLVQSSNQLFPGATQQGTEVGVPLPNQQGEGPLLTQPYPNQQYSGEQNVPQNIPPHLMSHDLPSPHTPDYGLQFPGHFIQDHNPNSLKSHQGYRYNSTAAPSSTPAKNKYICGIKGTEREGRVVGGDDGLPGEWCWQAALINSLNQYLCGAALVGTQWVLTAAHCVTNIVRSGDAIYVRVGDNDLTSKYGSPGAQTLRVATTYIHHNHNSQTLDNDIALLKLHGEVDLKEGVCLICLPARGVSQKPGQRCTVTGYGYMGESGPIPLKIREANLPVVSDNDCVRKINAVTEKIFILPASSFCAGGETGQDACQGDGGGPLVCKVDGFYELTGLVSWGFGCGRNEVPGVYVKVSSFIGWINQIISVNNL